MMDRRANCLRSGSVLIAVLVCMGIAMALLLGAVEMSLRLRRQARQDLQMEQTRWLLDAGINHAISASRANADYQGESITLSSNLSKSGISTVKIAVIPDEQQPPGVVRLGITARIGDPETNTKSNFATQRSADVFVESQPN